MLSHYQNLGAKKFSKRKFIKENSKNLKIIMALSFSKPKLKVRRKQSNTVWFREKRKTPGESEGEHNDAWHQAQEHFCAEWRKRRFQEWWQPEKMKWISSLSCSNWVAFQLFLGKLVKETKESQKYWLAFRLQGKVLRKKKCCLVLQGSDINNIYMIVINQY